MKQTVLKKIASISVITPTEVKDSKLIEFGELVKKSFGSTNLKHYPSKLMDNSHFSGNIILEIDLGTLDKVGSEGDKTPWLEVGDLPKFIERLGGINFKLTSVSTKKVDNKMHLFADFVHPITASMCK